MTTDFGFPVSSATMVTASDTAVSLTVSGIDSERLIVRRGISEKMGLDEECWFSVDNVL